MKYVSKVMQNGNLTSNLFGLSFMASLAMHLDHNSF